MADRADRRVDNRTRTLINEIDERLRDAERLRNHVENRGTHEIWPDRRRVDRIPDVHPARPAESGGNAK